jgi:multicomponent Na+:H+ antiporter subunit C
MIGHLPYFAAIAIFCAGLWGVITSRNLLHMIACLSVLQSSTYMLLVAIAYRRGGRPPVFDKMPPTAPTTDPVLQALMLTDIVIEIAVMALLIGITLKVYERRGSLDPDELSGVRG